MQAVRWIGCRPVVSRWTDRRTGDLTDGRRCGEVEGQCAEPEGGEGASILGLVGFKLDSSEMYVIQESSVNKLVVEAALTELANAINNPFFGAL